MEDESEFSGRRRIGRADTEAGREAQPVRGLGSLVHGSEWPGGSGPAAGRTGRGGQQGQMRGDSHANDSEQG